MKASMISLLVAMTLLLTSCSTDEPERANDYVAGRLITHYENTSAPTGKFTITLLTDSVAIDGSQWYPGLDIIVQSLSQETIEPGIYNWVDDNPLTSQPFTITNVLSHYDNSIQFCGGTSYYKGRFETVTSGSMKVEVEDFTTYTITITLNLSSGKVRGYYKGKLNSIIFLGDAQPD